LNKSKTYLTTWPDTELTEEQSIQYKQLIEQRANGVPLAYLTGTKSFWDLDLTVTPDVLIPRPETELLVELALSKITPGMIILELATGSGAIACSLAHARQDIEIIATDISEPALKIACLNVEKYNLKNIEFILSDWFEKLADQQFDLIIANPPYLSDSDPHLATDIRFEPRCALVSGKNGDEDYIAIISQAAQYLKPSGWILFEHGMEQGERVRNLLAEQGYAEIFTEKDLAGLERVTGGQFSPDKL
jgi:release factor glutamine methyltransferase